MDAVLEIWDKLVSVQKQPETWMLVVAWILAVGLTVTPLWGAARNIITVVHEGGHALMAVLWGRRVSGIKLHADTSGVTVSRGKPNGLGMIFTTAAGYTAPATLGLILAFLSATGRTYLALAFIGLSVALVFLSVRNIWGFVVTLPLTVGMYFLLQLNDSVQSFVLVAIAAFLTVASTRPVIELQRSRSKGEADESDADQLQRLTFVIPGIVWVSLFMLYSLAANGLTIWLMLSGSTTPIS